jgi:hypothetical protein
MINAERRIPNAVTVADWRRKNAKIGKLKAAMTEASEMILKIIKIISQMKTVSAKTCARPEILKARPKSTPRVVATPFPPLKLRNIVQLCPNIHPKPIAINMF